MMPVNFSANSFSPSNKAPQLAAAPKFGRYTTAMPRLGKMLTGLDYQVLGDTLIGQSQVIYASLIASRVIKARTNNERWEVLRRDPMGWYCWFMGKPMLEWALIQGMTGNSPTLRKMLLQKAAPQKGPLQTVLNIISPTRMFYKTSELQLKQRQQQVLQALERQGASLRRIKEARELFGRGKNILLTTSFIGLVFTVVALGIGINLINIAMTKLNLEKSKQENTPRPLV
jgi:hypothetical protein